MTTEVAARGYCPICRREMALKNSGVMAKHQRRDRKTWLMVECSGSGQAPVVFPGKEVK